MVGGTVVQSNQFTPNGGASSSNSPTTWCSLPTAAWSTRAWSPPSTTMDIRSPMSTPWSPTKSRTPKEKTHAMMPMVSSSTATGAAGQPELVRHHGSAIVNHVTKNMFLQLLVAQLQNQDPLNPTDGTAVRDATGAVPATGAVHEHRARTSPRSAQDLDQIVARHRQQRHGLAILNGESHVYFFFNGTFGAQRHFHRHRRGGQQPGQPEHARLQDQRGVSSATW